MADIVTLKNVNMKYKNGVNAIYDLSLSIQKGEFVFLIGGTGSGKSTVIKMLYREEMPSSGSIFVAGINILKLRRSRVYKLRRKLGVVFQDYRLLPKLTVYENVAFVLEAIGCPKEEIRTKTLKALELVNLKSKTRNFPDELSGGEQQRVAIARAIVNEPKLILCDEPTGNLDPKMSDEIMKVLTKINKDIGTTLIVSTHDQTIVNKYKKRVIVLKEGRKTKDYEEGKYNNEDI